MAYEKNTWQSGDVVTSAKLNNIENGIASGGVLVANGTIVADSPDDEGVLVLDCTWNEVNESALTVLRIVNDEFQTIVAYANEIGIQQGDNNYYYVFFSNEIEVGADSPDDYLAASS